MSEASSLVKLQEVDLQLLRISRTLSTMPKAKRLSDIDKAKRKLASQLKQLVGQRKDVEMELEDNEAAHDEVTTKIDGVKAEVTERVESYRRIQDLEAHLTALAKQQEKIEYRHADIEARLERLRTAEANARAIGERLLEEERTLKESFESASADLRAQARVLAQERKALVDKLSPEVLDRYDQAFKHFQGLAVEELRSNVPSTCRVKLQPSQFSSVVHGPRIGECPYCHRILVVREIGS